MLGEYVGPTLESLYLKKKIKVGAIEQNIKFWFEDYISCLLSL
jgi:hypothetical protein